MASRVQLSAIGFVVVLCAFYFTPSTFAVKVKQADDGMRNAPLQQTDAGQSNAGKETNVNQGNTPEAVEIDAVASEHFETAAQSFTEVPAAQIDAGAAKIDALPSQASEHLQPAAQSFNEVEALQAKLKEAKERRVAAEEHLKALQIEEQALWEKYTAHSALHGPKVGSSPMEVESDGLAHVQIVNDREVAAKVPYQPSTAEGKDEKDEKERLLVTIESTPATSELQTKEEDRDQILQNEVTEVLGKCKCVGKRQDGLGREFEIKIDVDCPKGNKCKSGGLWSSNYAWFPDGYDTEEKRKSACCIDKSK